MNEWIYSLVCILFYEGKDVLFNNYSNINIINTRKNLYNKTSMTWLPMARLSKLKYLAFESLGNSANSSRKQRVRDTYSRDCFNLL